MRYSNFEFACKQCDNCLSNFKPVIWIGRSPVQKSFSEIHSSSQILYSLFTLNYYAFIHSKQQSLAFIFSVFFICCCICQSVNHCFRCVFLVYFSCSIKMKLYAVSDGPPSLACRMVLKALNVPFELVPINYNIGEHLTDDYFKVNCV